MGAGGRRFESCRPDHSLHDTVLVPSWIAPPFARLTRDYDEGLRNQIGHASEERGRCVCARSTNPRFAARGVLGLQLCCGEFGCLPTVPRADRLAYYRDILSVFDADGVVWANWECKGDFGIYEWLGLPALCGAPDTELIRVLLPGKSSKR